MSTIVKSGSRTVSPGRLNAGRRRFCVAAFTLVELLVVIAIISILAGLLLPTLSRSVQSAKAVYCMNKQKQCGIAISMYCDDYEGRFLPGYNVEGVNGNYAAWSSFVTGIESHGYDSSGSSYLEHANDVRCPYHIPHSEPDDDRWVNYCYGGNTGMTAADGLRKIEYDNPLIILGSMRNPGSIPYLADTTIPMNGSWCEGWQYGAWHGNRTYGGMKSAVHLRHNGGANTIFLDMHCKLLVPGELESSGVKYYYFEDYTKSL